MATTKFEHKRMPFFSVVIPLYNKENWIEHTLNSVLNQTFDDYEIIIVNDGSTDRSQEIVMQFTNAKIKYFSKENQGVSVARNFGIEKATANYIAFLDADDLWFSNHLAHLRALIEKHPNTGIYASRYQLIFKNQSIYIPQFKGIPLDYSGIVADYFKSSLHYAIATSSSVAVSKEIFKTVGFFDTSVSAGEDTDMWIRIALKYPVIIGESITASYVHSVKNSLSKKSILQKKIKAFDFYREDELRNPSLKKYLDLYRMEYALQYKMEGKPELAQKLFKDIYPENIPLKSKVLFYTPSNMLVLLKKIKIFLRNNGIDFSIYQ